MSKYICTICDHIEECSVLPQKCPNCGFKVKAYFEKLKKEEEEIRTSYTDDEIENLQRKTISKRPMFNSYMGVGLGLLLITIVLFLCEKELFGLLGCVLTFMFLFTGISNLREEQEIYDKYKDDAEKYVEAQYRLQQNRELEYELVQQVRANQKKAGVKCPNCKSDNVLRITTANRAVSIAAVGLASGKIGKQYECRNCRHRW